MIGGANINEYMYGYVRMMYFKKTSGSNAAQIYEGRINGGYNKWNGFGRWVEEGNAFGWWTEQNYFNGLGIHHAGNIFQHSGLYDNSKMFLEPKKEFVVLDLSN